jgi:His/Glu/Gln/Arg/opine family amino acid ABC transporter permease subunit
VDQLQATLRFIGRVLPAFTEALWVTIGLAATALPLALAVGLIVVVPRLWGGRPLRALAAGYIEFMRNTPLLLQMFVIYFGLPLIGWRLDGFACGVLAIALQHGAFLAEVYRGAIQSISRFQWEAGRALGMRRPGVFFHVVLPQAVLKVIPPIANQLVVLVKDTSLAAGIGVVELTMAGKIVMERTAASYEVFIVSAVFYLVLTSVVGLAGRGAEAAVRQRM